jgi:hypothetical protein
MKIPENSAPMLTAVLLKALGNSQAIADGRRDVQRALRKEPESEHREHDAEDESIGAAVP